VVINVEIYYLGTRKFGRYPSYYAIHNTLYDSKFNGLLDDIALKVHIVHFDRTISLRGAALYNVVR
jgi:hypothetical protein